jgi:hopanoid biosynthesis associated protein HpnK
MKRLIVTADDFGRAVPINEAVADAHKRGILTSASLMVTGDAFADAVVRARKLPDLSVGLHLTLVDGKPILPPQVIPDLVRADGRLTDRLVSLGARIYLDHNVRRQVEEEIHAQFHAYLDTGLALGHVDAHHHYHLHPTVFDILLPIAVGYGCPAIRIPWEPLLPHGLFHLRRARKMRREARQAGLICNDRIFGVAHSGKMDSRRLSSLIAALPEGLSEIYCHPATRDWDLRPLPGHYRTREEYRALVDPATMDKVRRSGVLLTSFAAEARRALA